MTYFEIKAEIDAFEAPWGKTVKLQQLEYEGGMPMLRVQIRENKRFTDIDLDPVTARRWAQAMITWADAESAAGDIVGGAGGEAKE